MLRRLALSTVALLSATLLAACVSGDPNKTYDYDRAGFASDDGSR